MLKDLTGLRFNRLMVIDLSHRQMRKDGKGSVIFWRCMCDCGTIKTLSSPHLRRAKSCGCYRRENTARMKTTHGMTGTSIYYIWAHVVERCTNPNNERYANYGGRGIKVCDRWKRFEGFLADMGPSWFDGASIERKDVDGDYCAGNCSWIPLREQSKNRQSSIFVDTPWGTMNAIYVARRLGLSPGTFYWRIKRWPKERWLEPRNR